MLKNINLVLLIGILFPIYMMQGFLYPSGSIISQGILLVILAIGGMCFIGTLLHKNIPAPAIVFTLFFLMLLLTYVASPKIQYGWKHEAIGAVATFGQFKNACAFSLLFFIGYYTEIRQNVNQKIITTVFVILLVVAVIMFFHSKSRLLLELDREGVTVNAAYKFVVLIPFLPLVMNCLKNKYVRIGIVASMMSLIIMGSKRGAILCMLASSVFILYYYLHHTRLSVKKIIAVLFVVLLGCTFLFYSIEQNEYLTGRLEKMEKSGIGTRNIAYSELWKHWYSESSNFAYLFGNGSAASIGVWGNYAHNDWLELLTDNGLLGVVMYMSMFFSFLLLIYRSLLSPDFKLSMYLCLLIWLLQTFFSMGYTDVGNGVYTLLLGILTGKDITVQNEIDYNHEGIVVD